jgi:hypothetical protein
MFMNARSQSEDLVQLAGWMAGSFDSQEQHLKDTANYFDIRLEIIPVWDDRKDGYWFYVEQAVADHADKPYRQRIYQLTEPSAGLFESKIYLLDDPLQYAGQAHLIEDLNPDSVTEKKGCSVYLRKIDGHTYKGGTEGKNCSSERQGSTYATSEVLITETMMESWDRGFNDKDEHVWGAELGAYKFIKHKE